MGLKITTVILLTLLVVSATLNVFLYKQTNFQISFDSLPQTTQVPTETPTSSFIPVIDETHNSSKEINQTFTIPLTDAEGNITGEIAYTLSSYELTNEIVVNGKIATAVEERQFLIIDIQITNPLDRAIEINTKDYLRLSVNNSEDWVAPDIHNDPTRIEPISSKFTRLGFPVNVTDKDFRLQFGELDGNKEIINL